MNSLEAPLMVIGHRNPDTDSICSAIAYAHYKRDVAGEAAVPYRAGNLNPQTKYVLDYFCVASPEQVSTLQPRISDIMIQGKDLLVLAEDDTVGLAQEIITKQRFAFLPVAGAGGKYVGKITALRLVGLLQDLADLSRNPESVIRFASFMETVEGKVICGEAPDLFTGSVWLQGFEPEPADTGSARLAILPSGSTTFPDAGIVVLCSTKPGDEVPAALISRASCVVTTPMAPLEVATRLCLAMPLREFVERQHPTIRPYQLVRDVQKEIRKSNEGGFSVVDDEGFLCGIVTRLNFLSPWKFRVALVDHNELSQCVDGMEDAEVEEIIDHHRLGYRGTDQPITFINKVVGCTSTIIAELYHNADKEPPPEIAGLMMAAILSDTVILQSPTTTPLDQRMAEWLAGLAGEDLKSFGTKMFAAGSAAEGMDPKVVVRQDMKVYEESDWKLGVSQMETVGFDAFKQIRLELGHELELAREESGCHFSCLMVTDITSSTSLLLCTGEEKIITAITYPQVGENLFEMSGVLSRKKQMMPYLTDLLR
ncbi:MAG: putative manganese-dependent inorganic diphosphatase, partial [Luteolibacter sp.]